MKELFSLGKLYPSDFLKPDEQPRCEPVELKLMLDDDGRVRLSETAPKEAMYGKYWYRSSVTNSMKAELKDIVDSILRIMRFKRKNKLFCDIASNDGTLLSYVPKDFIRIGIDPVDNSYYEEARCYADLIIQDYFSADVYKKC